MVQKHLFFELLRYGTTTAISLVFLYGGLHVAETIHLPSSFAYAVLITIVYIAVYLSYSHFVFRTKPNQRTLFRFVLMLIASWIANNLLFHVSIQWLHLTYGIALLINTFVLGWIRFILQKTFVFGKTTVLVDV